MPQSDRDTVRIAIEVPVDIDVRSEVLAARRQMSKKDIWAWAMLRFLEEEEGK